MDEILNEFIAESRELLEQINEILEQVEEDPSQFKKLEKFGQVVDRIMGGAKTVALDHDSSHPIHAIANFTEICKVIGYKASQSGDKIQLITVTTAFLMDAMEMLEVHLKSIEKGETTTDRPLISNTFLDRLRWLADHFDENLRSTVAADVTDDKLHDMIRSLGVKQAGPKK